MDVCVVVLFVMVDGGMKVFKSFVISDGVVKGV